MMEPFGIATFPNGDLVYTDIGNHTVNLITSKGERKRLTGREGRGKGEFRWPRDVAVNCKNQLVITDYSNKRLQVLSEAGRFVREVEVDGYPHGICAVGGDYYVTTFNPVQIIRCDKDFKVASVEKRGEFQQLEHLVHHQGHLYIADWKANIIHVMTVDLQYVMGIGEGKLTRPCGITIDKNRMLIITDGECVKVMALDGEMVEKMGEGRLREATGITADTAGDKVIVCDWGNDRIVRL